MAVGLGFGLGGRERHAFDPHRCDAAAVELEHFEAEVMVRTIVLATVARLGKMPETGQQVAGQGGIVLRVVDQALGFQHLRSEEHTSELQSLMRIPYAVFCLKKK